MGVRVTELISQLDWVFSREQGLILLRSIFSELSDDLAEALSARAQALKIAGETVLGEDFSAWASETRSLVTRRLATSAESEKAKAKFLGTQQSRFDDAFYDLCFRVASHKIDHVYALMENWDPEASDPTGVAEELDAAAVELAFLTVIGKLTNNSQYQARTSLLKGSLLLFRSQWETRQARKSDSIKTSVEASKALEFAAASSALSAELRALAEMRLAALAGPSNPEAVAHHQEAALLIAEAGKAWDLVSAVRRDQAYWAKVRGDWHKAWELYSQNIKLSEKEIWKVGISSGSVALEARTQPDYKGSVEACLLLAKSDPLFYQRALESAEHGKARTFLQKLGRVGTTLESVSPKLNERRSRILQQMSDHPPASAEEAERLQLALKTVEDQIWTHPRAWAMNLQCMPCTYKQMCALVPKDGVILSYFTLPDRLLIFVLGENGLATPPVVVNALQNDLSRLALELQAMIRLRGDYQSIDDMQKHLDMAIEAFNPPLYLRKFHEILLEPVVSHLQDKRLIIIVPHGVLNGLPFHAFSDANGRALVEDSAVVYAPGLSVLGWCRQHNRGELNTCFAAGVCKLAGGPTNAKQEALRVAQTFGVTPGVATRSQVLQNAGNCDVIHLSCHSDMAPVFTAFSGLGLEDGTLRQHEIVGMQCHSTLVTLSACETARADTLTQPGDDFAGLVGAFFRAGCPSVVASLWPVADAVAVTLAEKFYNALKIDRLNIAEALRQAQLAVKAQTEEGYDDPYFWAPFCLWGNV